MGQAWPEREVRNEEIKPRGSANDASRRLACPGWSDAHHEKSFSSPGLDPSSSTEGQLHRAPSGAECVGTHAPKQRFSKCPSGISTPHPGCATKAFSMYVFFIAARLIIFYVHHSFILVAFFSVSLLRNDDKTVLYEA